MGISHRPQFSRTSQLAFDSVVTMEEGTPLDGSCSCGRNHYVIYAPPNPLGSLQLLYDERAEHGQPLYQCAIASQTHTCSQAELFRFVSQFLRFGALLTHTTRTRPTMLSDESLLPIVRRT